MPADQEIPVSSFAHGARVLMRTANKLLTRVPVSYALDWVGTSRVSLRSMLGVALSDEQYVRDQYRSTENLDVRTSVWKSDVEGGSPHDFAERALREVGASRVLEIGSITSRRVV